MSTIKRRTQSGELPSRQDGSGVHRIDPRDLAEYAAKHGLTIRLPGPQYALMYEHFLAPGFRPTREAIGRIVVATRESPKVVRDTYEEYLAGAGADTEGDISRHYDDQIRALDKELERRRRPRRKDDDDLPDSR